MKTSNEINEISKAMAAMQGEMTNAPKDCKGYNYKYADLAAVWGMIREPLRKHSLFIVQEAIAVNDGVSVSTRVIHASGQWFEFEPLTIPIGKKDAHSTGSAITYAKRYQLCAALGVVTDDDDGMAAQKSAKTNTVDDTQIIDEETFEKLNIYINGHEDIRVQLQALCKVNDLRNIKKSQIEVVRSYAKKHIQAKKEK